MSDGDAATRELHDHGGWWKPLVVFGTHTLVGTLIFLIIFLPAVALNVVVHHLEERRVVSNWLVWAAVAFEVFLVGVDMVLYVIFFVKEATRAIKEL